MDPIFNRALEGGLGLPDSFNEAVKHTFHLVNTHLLVMFFVMQCKTGGLFKTKEELEWRLKERIVTFDRLVAFLVTVERAFTSLKSVR